MGGFGSDETTANGSRWFGRSGSCADGRVVRARGAMEAEGRVDSAHSRVFPGKSTANGRFLGFSRGTLSFSPRARWIIPSSTRARVPRTLARSPASRRVAAMPASKSLTVFHYNDVYNLESGSREPVGGAARFLSVVASRSSESPLVLFGGDALNPSMASTFFKGRQMIPALNLIGTRAACVGNHDLDFGMENLAACVRESDFPWLLANITLARDGEHLCGAVPTAVIHHDGVKVGIVGLAEEEWIDTLSAVSPEDLRYEDFVACGRRLATELRDDGCEVVLALTHMREPNDERLAREAPEFDAVLGGHDHHCVTRAVEPHGVPVLKAGTEFRWLVAATFAVPADGGRPVARWETIEVTSDIPEHPDMKRIADDVETKLGDSMDVQIGETCVPLEGRFLKVRTEETNLGNLVADILRDASGADACVLNGGTLRSDVIHPPGALTFRDLVAILPMLDETCVLEMTGAGIVEALENACSAYPALEGRFAQVSGLAYVFDAARPAGSRVVSVEIPRGTPLAPEKNTACARKRTSRSGRTGTIRSRRRGCARCARRRSPRSRRRRFATIS